MNHRQTIAALGFVAAALFLAANVHAQSCASPIEIGVTGVFNGDTCNSTNQFDYLVDGAVFTPGNQDVYHMVIGDGTGVSVLAAPTAGQDISLFVCRSQCGAHASCVAAADSGGGGSNETASLPPGPGEYFVIVHTPAACGTYALSVAAPLP